MKQSARRWLTPILGSVLAVITGVIYAATATAIDYVTYGRLLGMALVPWVFSFFEMRGYLSRSTDVTVLITVHVVLAGYGGSVLGWYGTVTHFDLWMHAFFGVVASACLSALLRCWNGKALHPFGFHFMVCLGVMGGAALWEIFEFLCDFFLNMDSQKVNEALLLGRSPIADTMTDILITAAGIVIFYLFEGIKKVAHRE